MRVWVRLCKFGRFDVRVREAGLSGAGGCGSERMACIGEVGCGRARTKGN